MEITLDNSPASMVSDDDSDIGIRRQWKAMRKRLEELELLHATRHKHQVPVNLSEIDTKHGYRCGMHQHVVVSMKTPRVECAVCHEALDPLDVLREFAKQERSFASSLEHLRTETADLRKEIEALKKQKQNLRNAVRKAGGKPIERWHIKYEEHAETGQEPG